MNKEIIGILWLSDNFSAAALSQTYKVLENLIGLIEMRILSVATTDFFSHSTKIVKQPILLIGQSLMYAP